MRLYIYIYIYVCTYIQYPHLLYVVSTWSNMACWRLHVEKSMSFPASRLHPEVFQHGDEALNVAAINTPSQTVPRCCDVLCKAEMRQWSQREKSPFVLGKLTISMAMFNSYVSHYQRVRDERDAYTTFWHNLTGHWAIWLNTTNWCKWEQLAAVC